MNSMIFFLKEAIGVWKETTVMFWGNNGFFCLFCIALIVVLYFDKNKTRKASIAWCSLIILFGLYNPITYYLCRPLFHGSYAYYARLYSLVPVPFLIAYAFAFIIERYKGIPKLILFLLLEGIIILGGTNVYKEDWIQKAENCSKLQNDVVELCDQIHGFSENVCLAAPSELAVNIRQYDGSIIMPYGRFWGFSELLRTQLDSDYPDVDSTLTEAGNKACDFIVVRKNDENKVNFAQAEQELFGETDNYLIYKLVNVPRVINKYNKYHQIIESRYVNADGSLRVIYTGYAIIRYKYDNRGNIVSEEYYGDDEKPVYINYGYCAVSMEYNKKNEKTAEYYYDENGTPVRLSLGQYGVKLEYDGEGRVIKTTYLDKEGDPVICYLGYSIKKTNYDDKGNVISEYSFDANGNPVEQINGHYGYKKEYDENNRVVSIMYVDKDDNPVMASFGYSKIIYSYNEKGELKEEKYYDNKGDRVKNLSGFYGINYTYDEYGRQIATECVDVDGNLINTTGGFSTIKKEYDEAGNVIIEKYYDRDMNPVPIGDGQFGKAYKYNDEKRVISLTYIDSDSRPIEVRSGVSEVKYNYDKYGNISEELYYNKDGNPIKLETGEYGQKKEYDDKNLLSEITFIDRNGNPVETKNGYSVIKREYNWRRSISAEYYFDSDSNPVANTSGYYGYKRESNLYNQDVYITYLGKNHDPMEIEGAIHSNETDKSVNTGKNSKIKYSSLKIYYDKDNKLASKVFYNLKGEDVDRIDYQTWNISQYSDDSNNQGLFYTLKNTETGTLIVIDGGSTANADHVRQVINSLGGTVDAWIVTHYHEDHCGAYNAIQDDPQGITIKKVYASKFDSDYDKFIEVAKDWDDAETFETWMNNSANSDNVYYPNRGETISVDNLKITFLNTYDDKLLELNGESDLPNNCALVTLIEGDEDSMLFMSDMYSPSMGEYLEEEYGEKIKNVKYLQPPHHGNSIMPYTFYEFIDPDVIFFDAPEWLMEGDEWNAKGLKEWCDENGIRTYDYGTALNTIEIR